jgi:hypothetical protein
VVYSVDTPQQREHCLAAPIRTHPADVVTVVALRLSPLAQPAMAG